MKTITRTLARGWKTSKVTGDYLEAASHSINRTVADLVAIGKDRTMTQAQRSPALSDLHRASQAALNKVLNNARSEADARFITLGLGHRHQSHIPRALQQQEGRAP